MPTQGQPDHNGARSAWDKAEDAVGAAVGMASAKTAGSHSTDAFVNNAVEANRYEIEAAHIALDRSSADRVRSFAQDMIDDHTRLGERMRRQLSAAGLEVNPSHPLDQRRQGMLDNLHTAPADQFDRRYLDQQEVAHRETVSLFEGYSEHGDNGEVKAAASEALPLLRKHLEKVTALRGQ